MTELSNSEHLESSKMEVELTNRPIAIFDLDGTLTTQDSFVAFLITFGRRNRKIAALSKMPFLIASYLGGMIKDFELKQKLIGNFFGRVDPEIVAEHAEWFCEQWLPNHLHPIGNQLLHAHLDQGHRVILLSASPELFVPQIAATLSIPEVVCTRVQRVDGRWQGKLLGKNCKGEQKRIAIQDWLGVEEAPSNSFSYGDSRSDLPILSWVHYGAWIRPKSYKPLKDTNDAIFSMLTGCDV